MTVLLHAAGGMLLLCAGMGCGFTAAAHIRDCQRQLHSLSRLFGYLAELLNAQALAGPELLHRAARNLQTSARRVLQRWQICSFHPACPRPCGAKPCRRFAALRNHRA